MYIIQQITPCIGMPYHEQKNNNWNITEIQIFKYIQHVPFCVILSWREIVAELHESEACFLNYRMD